MKENLELKMAVLECKEAMKYAFLNSQTVRTVVGECQVIATGVNAAGSPAIPKMLDEFKGIVASNEPCTLREEKGGWQVKKGVW